jgi:NAD(P)-dependent dehydrogenase (short-subunit alcohol dehydrogenase family)
MKVIVITGASSGVGKTTLAGQLQHALKGAEVVKIGHGKRKPEVGNHFYASGTPFQTIRENHSGAEWLIVESNSILREIQPDLVIYLEGETPKPSAQYARCRADIISGRAVSEENITALAARLGIAADLMRMVVQLAQQTSCRPDSG